MYKIRSYKGIYVKNEKENVFQPDFSKKIVYTFSYFMSNYPKSFTSNLISSLIWITSSKT